MFSQNHATSDASGSGGALWIESDTGSVQITGTQFLDNQARSVGGAIFSHRLSALTMSGNEFRSNSITFAGGSGGAIYTHECERFMISDSTFDQNAASLGSSFSGAIFLQDSNVEIVGSTFSRNVTQYGAGAVSAWNSSGNLGDTTFQITKSTFSENRAVTNNGGVLYIQNTGTWELTDFNRR